MKLKYSEFDIFGKRLGLFYKNKEKISSLFGLASTFVYIIVSAGIFLYYAIQTIKHKDLIVYDSTVYSKDVPSIDLNNTESLYFAFAVEEPETAAKFIDETIYTASAVFVDCDKDEKGTFFVKELRDLKVERCDQKKFGKSYQHLFTEGEFNNSYCINTFDFALTGGFIYSNLSLIKIDISPCKNTSGNNYHCKPQETIDKYLAGGYFSILLKDIGLNPSNYSFPILPTLQDIYTTISKQIYRDLMLYYEITEIKTDTGIFVENINSEKLLKFDKKIETFYLRSEEYYYRGESIIGIQIRLSDNIHVQKREYNKMQNVFATAGGYMQMLNVFFSLLSIFPNKFIYDNIILNNLFDFERKRNKIVLKEKTKKSPNKKTYMNDLNSSIKDREKTRFNITLKSSNKDFYNYENKSEKRSKNNPKNYINSIDKSINISANEKMSNFSKNDFIPFSMNQNVQILNNKWIKFGRNNIDNNIIINEEYLNKDLKLNILEYFCIGICRHKKKKYNQIKKGILIFKQKLDIINVFNYILYCEKKSNENINQISIY